MRGNILNKFIILICCVSALISCKAHKQLIVNQPARQPQVANPVTQTPPVINAKAINNAILANQAVFNTFSGKAKARLDIDGSSNDVTLNIHIQRDKRIWVSVTATVLVQIEVARALITPDSILIINKLQGVYMKKPFSYIYQYAGNQVDFKAVQALLVGNALPQTLTDNSTVTADSGSTILTGNQQDMLYRVLVTGNRVRQTDLSNAPANLMLQVSNNDFTQVDNRSLPSQINIVSSAGTKKINASLHYNSAEFDKILEYPFNIPGSYTPVN